MAAHDLFSRYVGIPLANFQRAVRPAERSRYIWKRRAFEFRNQAKGWPQTEKEQWVLKQLRHAVRNAARGTVYYASLFKRIGFNPDSDFGFDEFAKLPILEKEDIARAGTISSTETFPQTNSVRMPPVEAPESLSASGLGRRNPDGASLPSISAFAKWELRAARAWQTCGDIIWIRLEWIPCGSVHRIS